ncbi:MAG: MATE family efflux transporter [Oscillospiraceae bacterium]|nr:MATE family efflux transporter [Oscillospiraceae bacterium]
MEQKENRLGTMPIKRLVGAMALPLIISNMVQALYNIADSVFVAQISENATKAISLAFPVQMLMIAVSVGTGVGTSSLMSRKLGEKNFRDAELVANQGFFLAAVSYAAFLLFGLFCSEIFFTSTTDNAEIIADGTVYLRIVTACSLGLFLQINCERILQGTGNALWSMILQLIGAATNILLDPVLIFGMFGLPAMGITGAALATIIGQLLAAAVSVLVVFVKVKEVQISFREMKPRGAIILNIYKVGLPSIVMQALNSVILTVVNALVMPVSEVSVWILGVYFKVQSFVFMPVFGLNNGIIPIIAYNYGARRRKRITETISFAMTIALTIMAAGTVALCFFPNLVLSMFNPTAETAAVACHAFRIIASSFVFSGVAIVSSAVFQALGKGFTSLVIASIRQAIVLLPVLIALLYLVGANAIWYAYPCAEIVACILSAIIMVRTYRKQIREIPA